MDHKIIWEKWYDVLPVEEEYQDDYPEDDEELEEERMIGMVFPNDFQNPKIRTPLGTFYMDEPLSPNNMYDCWVGHTNFRLTTEDFKVLDEYVDGVEVVKLMSKYRFFIGIGKLFDFKDVQKNIHIALSQQDSLIFDAIKDKEWSAFISDDGSVKHVFKRECIDDEDYIAKTEELKAIKNGSFITSVEN